MTSYQPPLSLVVLGTIFIGLGLWSSIIILCDILLRRGWRSMMGIMIPVYLLNSLYLAPITLWVYFKYGRPTKPGSDSNAESKHNHCHTDDNSQNGHEDQMQQAEEKHSEMGHSSRPMFATLTVAACHCGAGCLLGDIVGEWLVYRTDAKINGRNIWVEYLVDYGFALLFGIIFQYFPIAPMANDYGPGTIWRAMKADIVSLTAFQIGLYGWMAIYQIAIWEYKLKMNNVVYWWMMQVGMFAGHWTSAPMNWLLIRYRVKEPCA